MYGNVRKVERWQSCSLWTKCFISFLACSSLWVGVDSACWKRERNPSEAQSDVHICSSPRLTAASQAGAARPHTHNKCTFIISLCSILFPLFFSLSFPSLFSLCFAPRENKMFSENEIRNMMFQVLSGLVFVHKHGKKLPSYVFLSFFCCCFGLRPFAWATA